jgi:hypothetical protein
MTKQIIWFQDISRCVDIKFLETLIISKIQIFIGALALIFTLLFMLANGCVTKFQIVYAIIINKFFIQILHQNFSLACVYYLSFLYCLASSIDTNLLQNPVLILSYSMRIDFFTNRRKSSIGPLLVWLALSLKLSFWIYEPT